LELIRPLGCRSRDLSGTIVGICRNSLKKNSILLAEGAAIHAREQALAFTMEWYGFSEGIAETAG
jgi:hypothetical protein